MSDPLAPCFAIRNGLLFAIPFWVAIIYLIHWAIK